MSFGGVGINTTTAAVCDMTTLTVVCCKEVPGTVLCEVFAGSDVLCWEDNDC